MTTTQLVVTLLGAGLIGWVNWYFFLAARAEGRPEASDVGPAE